MTAAGITVPPGTMIRSAEEAVHVEDVSVQPSFAPSETVVAGAFDSLLDLSASRIASYGRGGSAEGSVTCSDSCLGGLIGVLATGTVTARPTPLGSRRQRTPPCSTPPQPVVGSHDEAESAAAALGHRPGRRSCGLAQRLQTCHRANPLSYHKNSGQLGRSRPIGGLYSQSGDTTLGH